MSSIQRQCGKCGTKVKSTGGLTRHKRYCLRQQKRKKGRHEGVDIEETNDNAPLRHQSSEEYQTAHYGAELEQYNEWPLTQYMDDDAPSCHQTSEGHYTTNCEAESEQGDEWPPAQALGDNIVDEPNDGAADVHYNNDSATFNRVHNLAIVETDRQTLTGTSMDVFRTETFEEATGRAARKASGTEPRKSANCGRYCGSMRHYAAY